MTDRNRTRVIAIIHSHIQRGDLNGVIDCSADLREMQTSKSIKGSGNFSFTLLPRKNYLNYIFPDDVVNIYMDPGDGKRGFVRLMMGYVDRIERTEQVNDQGAMSTGFRVTGTDFTKAIDKTEIYFNPALADRDEFLDPRFGLSQLGGGHALRTRGITAYGTPAQFVENLLQLLLGFGSQWVLPRSYPSENFLDKTRSKRRQRAKQIIPESVKANLAAVFNINIEQIGLDQDITQQIIEKQNSINNKEESVLSIKEKSSSNLEKSNQSYNTTQAALSNLLSSVGQLLAYQTTLKETQENSPASILDILSFDFIEALAIDGFVQARSVWTSEGSLGSLLYGWTNEIVNELCFDLRPVAVDSKDQCFGTEYSTDADELKINRDGTATLRASVSAIQYTPAVILREYPYSVVEGLDLSHFNVMGSPAGFQAFGPIFSAEKDTPGRKIYNYQSALGPNGVLTPDRCSYDANSAPLKHLDVVTIENTDVTGSQIGRSDADIFNLFELYATSPKPDLWKYIIREILPIITPISIQRHGLRVRSLTTKFAAPGRDKNCNATDESGVDNAFIRRSLIRWTLLLDHWYQHNIEYLTGTIALKPMPEIRVGYRLDWKGRNESYYVESVQHQWAYPSAARTTIQVSRGQRNDPYTAYIPPILTKTGGLPAGAPTHPVTSETTVLTQSDQELLQRQQSSDVAKAGGGDRSPTGRLGELFLVRDTRATSFSVGGEVKFSADNDVDKKENVPGFAVFPENFAPRDQKPDNQLGDFAAPYQGDKPA